MLISRFGLISAMFAGVFMLVGCFGSGDIEAESVSLVPNSDTFVVDEFDIQYPRTWNVLTRKDFPGDVPREALISFQSDIKGEFTVNVNIGREKVELGKSSLDFAKKALVERKNGLLDFKEISRDDLKLAVGEAEKDTLLVTYDAKSGPEAHARRFIQTYLVKDEYVYVVTATLKTNEEESVVDICRNMIKSFRLK